MGTTDKNLEDLKKELSNMHKQFDSLLADKKISEQLNSTVELENNTIDALENKKDILVNLDDEKNGVINLHDNVVDKKTKRSDSVLENENLTGQEGAELTNENDFLVKEIEKQKQKNQYLSIKEKLDKIKGEINTKELEISLKSLGIEDIEDDSPKKLVQKPSVVNTKKKK